MVVRKDRHHSKTTLEKIAQKITHVGRIGSGVRVSAIFQIFAFRMLLQSAEVTSRGGGHFL